MSFDKVIYINLNRRPDRQKNMEDILQHFDMTNISERFPAIDGKTLDLDKLDRNIISQNAIDDAVNNRGLYTVMTKGGIGCALSHYNVYKKIVDEKINRCLILEDDIRINANFYEALNSVQKELNDSNSNDFDMLFLGYHRSSISHPFSVISKNLYVPTRVYGLFGYIVSYQGAKKLLDTIFPLERQIDSAISDYSSNFKIILLAPNSRIIFSDESSIHTKFGTDIQLYDDNVTTLESINNKKLQKLLAITLIILVIAITTLVVILMK